MRVSHPFGNPSPYHGVHSNQKALCLSLPQHLPSVLNHVLTSDSRFHIRNLWRLNTGLFNLSTKLKKFFFPTIRKILQTESFQNFKLLPNQIISKHYTTHIQSPNKTQQLWQHTHRSNPPKFRKIKKKGKLKNSNICGRERCGRCDKGLVESFPLLFWRSEILNKTTSSIESSAPILCRFICHTTSPTLLWSFHAFRCSVAASRLVFFFPFFPSGLR